MSCLRHVRAGMLVMLALEPAMGASSAAHVETKPIVPEEDAHIAARKRGAALLRREAELLQQREGVVRSQAKREDPDAGDDTAAAVHSRSMSGYGIAGLKGATDGDEGDVGLHLAGEDADQDDVSMESMASKKESYTVWEAAHKEGDHMLLHWLEFGCPTSLIDNTTFSAHTRFEKIDQRMGRVQCCGSSNETHGTWCTRRDEARNGTCFGGGGLHTFMEARNICNAANMRLCTKQEIQTSDALGCCSDECSMNQELVWTSTHDFTTVRKDNDDMKTEIERLEEENAHLRDDHEAMREEYRQLVAQIQEYFDQNPTTQAMRVSSTVTTTVYGLSANDIQELRQSADFVHESHEELKHEADALSSEWKTIMDHSPDVEVPAVPAAGMEHTVEHVGADVKEPPVSDEEEAP